jgi:hypothetical protein
MRSLLLAGTAGLFLALGAANAFAAAPNSPYAIMVPPDAVDGYPQNGAAYPGQRYGYDDVDSSGMVEGRTAFVDPDYGYDDPGYVDPGYYGYPGPVGGFNFGGGRGGHFGGGHFGGHHFGGGHFGGGPRHR